MPDAPDAYKGFLTSDQLYVEVGRPSQNPASDTYFPRPALDAILQRHLDRVEAAIESALNEAGPDNVAHLTEQHILAVKKNYATPGLAGGELPNDVIAYIYRAYYGDAEVAMAYDNDLPRLARRALPGVTRYAVRLSGRDVECLPNADGALHLYVVRRERALEGVMPTVIEEINAAVLRDARSALAAGASVKGVVKQQSKETRP